MFHHSTLYGFELSACENSEEFSAESGCRANDLTLCKVVLTNYDGLDLENLPAYYEATPADCFREEVQNMKIWFSSHNFVTYVGGRHQYLGGTIQEHDEHLHKIWI